MTQPNVHVTVSALSDAPYLKWLGLHTAPFLPDPDGPFIYEDAALNGQLGVLQHLVRFSDLLIVITGDKGVGKTTLIRQFLSQYEGRQTCFIQAHAFVSADEILQQLGHPTLRPVSDKPDAEEHAAQPAAVVIIDDAHKLPLTTLQALLELATAADENGRRFRVLMAGEPLIEELLAKLGKPLGQAGTYALQMPPLSEEECARYLQHRLDAAGLHGPSPLTADHVRILHRISGGIPARLDVAAHRLLLVLSARAEHPNPYGRHFAQLVALLRRYLPSPHRLAQPRALVIGAAVITLLATPLFFQGKSGAPTRPVQQTIPLPLPPPREPVAHLDRAMPVLAEIDAERPAEPTPMPVSAALADAGEPAEEADTIQSTAIDVPPAEVHAAAPRTSIPAEHADAKADSETPAATAQETPTPTMAKRDPTPVAQHESWLLAQNDRHYTLQLLGTRNESAVLDLIKAHRLEDQVAYFHTYYKGEDWYVLLYGIYSSRDAALAAAETLPKPIRELNPWVRGLASVHADIAKSRGKPTP